MWEKLWIKDSWSDKKEVIVSTYMRTSKVITDETFERDVVDVQDL